jgi:hypothetical protein
VFVDVRVRKPAFLIRRLAISTGRTELFNGCFTAKKPKGRKAPTFVVTESYRENGRKKRYDDNSKELHVKRCALQRDRGRRYFLGSKQDLNMTERPRPSWSNSDWKIDGLEVGGWVWCTIMLVFPKKHARFS